MTSNRRQRLPRKVSIEWIESSWNEKTRLDEESKTVDLIGMDGPLTNN